MNTAMAANADPEFNKRMVKYWMPVQLGLDRPIERASLHVYDAFGSASHAAAESAEEPITTSLIRSCPSRRRPAH